VGFYGEFFRELMGTLLEFMGMLWDFIGLDGDFDRILLFLFGD
jgi:hypothetical protein